MTGGIDERVHWIALNILPHERTIRAWLGRHRVHDLDVDDIIQEMYTKIGSIEHFETIRTPKSYAFQVAHSILISHVRRSQIVSLTSDGNLEDLDVASPEASPEDEVGFRDEMKQVANTIAALPPRTRDVLLLRRVEGLSQRETAERLDIAEKTVEMHMARAVYVLMKQFGRGGKSAPRASSVVVHAADEESDVTRS